MSAQHQWNKAYQVEDDTKYLVDRLLIDSPFDEPTTTKLPTAYRSTIARNLIGLLEGSLIYYEIIPIATKHMCRIIIP